MYREAVADCERKTEMTAAAVLNKPVTINIEIDPGNGTFDLVSITPAGDVWPGDTLTWNFVQTAGSSGTLDLTKLTVELPRLGITVTKAATAPFFQKTLPPKPLSLGARNGRVDGSDGPTTHAGVGHKLTLNGQGLTRVNTRLVIDTSGPPPMQPCPPDPERGDRRKSEI